MSDTREKLMELLTDNVCKHEYCVDCEYYKNEDGCVSFLKEKMADHLIANGVTVQKWIPMSEPPKNCGLYLVIEKHWLDGSPCRRIAKWNTVDWFTADRKSKEITPRVTHWMPLPEPPKEE